MSGIAAIFNLDGAPADRALVDRMLAAARYRGIDGSRSWSEGPIALGHALLQTTPESLGEVQPLVDTARNRAIIFNGRIDNRDDLRTILGRDASRLRTDAEFALASYERWGDAMPERILGDFGFALWDGRRRCLMVARDPLGIVPIYYFIDDRVFICASEMQQILVHPRISLEPNEPMVAETLGYFPYHAEETLYRGIYRVAASFLLSVTPRGIEKRRYYDLNPAKEIRYRRDEEYADHFRSLLFDAVRCRLRSHGAVTADLSGGLDSSSIVAVTKRLIDDGAVSVSSFEPNSVTFERPEADERRYVADFEAMWELRGVHMPPKILTRAECVESAHHYRDLAPGPNGLLADFQKFSSEHGPPRIWLSGQGGDDFLSGSYYCYADMIRGLHLVRLIERLRGDYALYAIDPSVGKPIRGLYRYGVLPLVPAAIRRALRPYLSKPEIPFAVAPNFARRTRLLERIRQPDNLPVCRDLAQRDIYRSYAAGWRVYPMETLDRFAARLGAEPRHPFYDRRLLEFCFAIPEDQKLRGALTKFVMRNAMRELLPPSIMARRDKASFCYLYPETLRAMGGEHLFDSLSIARNGWVDESRVKDQYRRMIGMYDAGDFMYQFAIQQLWNVFAVEAWFNESFPRSTSDQKTGTDVVDASAQQLLSRA
jgi:asparagine synthase (glutamine-hydrolysing)